MMAAGLKNKICVDRLTGILSSRDLFGGPNAGDDALEQTKLHHISKPGDLLIASGQRPSGIFLLLKGQATLLNGNGSRSSIEGLRTDDAPVFGMFESLAGSRSEMQLTAATECEVAIVREDDVLAMLHQRPDVCLRVAAAAGRAYMTAVNAIRDH
jgi:hypothetical protein